MTGYDMGGYDGNYTPPDQGWVVPAAMQEVYGKLERLHAAYHHEGPWSECDTCHEVGPCFPTPVEHGSYVGMAYDGIIDIHRRHLEALDRCATSQAEIRMFDRERIVELEQQLRGLDASRRKLVETLWTMMLIQVVTAVAAILALVLAAG